MDFSGDLTSPKYRPSDNPSIDRPTTQRRIDISPLPFTVLDTNKITPDEDLTVIARTPSLSR